MNDRMVRRFGVNGLVKKFINGKFQGNWSPLQAICATCLLTDL